MFALSTRPSPRACTRPGRVLGTTRVTASVGKTDRVAKSKHAKRETTTTEVPTRRRTVGQTLAMLPKFAPLFLMAHGGFVHSAHAAGWYNDVPSGGFVGGDFGGGGGEASGFGDEGEAEEYDYQTKDLAVDLASPLVAYKVVSWALNQEVPVWLDAITLAFTLAAIYVVFFDVTDLDDVLQ